jgi:hypothetical protein
MTIRDNYTSISVQVVNRACKAHELHGDMINEIECTAVLEEEFHELVAELNPVLGTDYMRIYEEAKDVAVVAIRIADYAGMKVKELIERGGRIEQ